MPPDSEMSVSVEPGKLEYSKIECRAVKWNALFLYYRVFDNGVVHTHNSGFSFSLYTKEK